ncbi:helical backbone metal receptor [Aquimarina rhabdastrellae]
MYLEDQLHRKIKLAQIPKRIVSLVPSQTELLVDLGLEEELVGITKFCVHPEHLRKAKKIVGGTKEVKYDRIQALQPDIILCNKEENTREIVTQLEKDFTVHVSDMYTIDDAITLITQYGLLFDREQQATVIKNKIISEYQDFTKSITQRPIKRVAYCIWRNPWMVAGNTTFIDHLLTINRFENVFKDQERYPVITLEDLKERAVDTILLSSEPYPFKEMHIEEIKQTLPSIDIQLVDGEYFSWYGSRLTKAFSYFRSL